jgi:hypothetical protein
MYKTKLPLFASKEKHVGKKHYLFLHKDFDRSKKLSQFTFNGQNLFFCLANTLCCYIMANVRYMYAYINWIFQMMKIDSKKFSTSARYSHLVTAPLSRRSWIYGHSFMYSSS